MLSKLLIRQVAEFVESQVVSAEAIIEEKAHDIPIMKSEIEGYLLKIYTNTADVDGLITNINLKNSKGEVIISKDTKIEKNDTYSVVSSFYINVLEEEIEKPIDIFKVTGRTKW